MTQDDRGRSWPGRLPEHWLPLLLLGLMVPAFWPTLSQLFSRWTVWTESMGHGLLVVGLFLFFLWRSLPWAATAPSAPVRTLLVLLLGTLSAAWFLFEYIAINLLAQLALVSLLPLLVAAVYGPRTVWRHWMLLLLPVFAIPAWDHLNEVLLVIASVVVGEFVRAIGIPAFIEGNSIFIPSGHFLIADGCSGLRYFIVAVLLGYLVAYINNYSLRLVLLTCGVAAALGILANWVRITGIIAMGHWTEMQTSLVDDHEFFGWVVFALICLPAMWLAPGPRAHQQQDSAAAPAGLPATGWLVAAVAALLTGPLMGLALDRQPQTMAFESLLPQAWDRVDQGDMPLPVRVSGRPDAEYAVASDGDTRIYVQAHQYQREAAGDKLVPYLPRPYDATFWTARPGPTPELRHTAGLVLEHKTDGRRIAQLSWYQVGSQRASSQGTAKLLQIPATLRGENHFAIVTMQAPCPAGDCRAAQQSLNRMARPLAGADAERQ
ncbi:MAG: exosortase/archaeosortase family protein [Chromatiales bacterium]|nr:exosortase/archaeosortase family protein [Chromatiales bacterium]